MTFNEFSKRCNEEYNSKVGRIAGIVTNIIMAIIFIVMMIIMINHPIPFFENEIINYVLSFFIYLFAIGLLISPIETIINLIAGYHKYSAIQNAARTGSYLEIPSDYPQCILYPGQPYRVTEKIYCKKCRKMVDVPLLKGTKSISCPQCGEMIICDRDDEDE